MPDEQDIPKQTPTKEATTEASQPDSSISQSETQQPTNMEVHHHPDLHHNKKKFKEYFLEFLMIFLAVTLGFFAEQIREDFTDHSREKQYMKLMIEDLKSDTVLLSSNVRRRQQRTEMIDSLIYLLTSPFIKENGNTIYFFARSISPPLNIFPNDRTIQQLKSSGSLRLIRDLNVSNGIMAYDQKMRQLLFELTDEIQIRSESRQLADKIFNGKVFNEMLKNNTINKPVNNPSLVTSDAGLINEYIVETQYMKNANRTEATRAEELLNQAKRLIDLIKQYDLE
ncbi:MAG TPA: hypothetical protein VK543_13550 [Puia sp.]|nr:hypothetical protein [Puia sp.]